MRIGKALRLQALDDVPVTEDAAILTLRNDVDVQGELLLHLPLRLTDPLSHILLRGLPDLNEPLIAGWRILRRPGVDPQARRGFGGQEVLIPPGHHSSSIGRTMDSMNAISSPVSPYLAYNSLSVHSRSQDCCGTNV